jgi:hypothetical protein
LSPIDPSILRVAEQLTGKPAPVAVRDSTLASGA